MINLGVGVFLWFCFCGAFLNVWWIWLYGTWFKWGRNPNKLTGRMHHKICWCSTSNNHSTVLFLTVSGNQGAAISQMFDFFIFYNQKAKIFLLLFIWFGAFFVIFVFSCVGFGFFVVGSRLHACFCHLVFRYMFSSVLHLSYTGDWSRIHVPPVQLHSHLQCNWLPNL